MSANRFGILFPPTEGPTGPTGPSGPTGPTGPTPTETYISADNSSTTQTITAGTPTLIDHYNVSLSNGISASPPATTPFQAFEVANTGVYKLLYSVQFLGDGNGEVAVWLVVNGNAVGNSSTYTAFKNGDEGVITCEYIVELQAGDTWSWGVEAIGSNVDLVVIPATMTIPLCPSIITNAYRLRS